MKKFLVLALALLMVLGLVACAKPQQPSEGDQSGQPVNTQAPNPQPGTSEPVTGGTVSYRIEGEPTTLLAWTTRNSIDMVLLRVIGETLLKYDANGEAQPYLVDSIVGDKAALTYTLKVKQGIKFHDGSDMTAEAVAWNLNNYKANGVLTGSFYGAFDNAEAVDETTVVMHMNKWDSLFPSALARTCYITSKVAYDTYGEEYLATNPVGTGPFMFQSWDHDVAVRTVKFADYWQGEPKLDGLDFVIYTDEVVAATALREGDLDILPINDYNLATQLTGDSSVVVAAANQGGTGYTLCFMCENPEDPLSDLRVRQAFAYAIDSTVFGDVVTQGYYIEGTQWCDANNPYYNDQVSGYPFDIEKAKQLLADAGYANGFSTRITLQAGWGEDQAQIIAEQLSKIGVTCELNIVEIANYAGYIGSWEYGMLLHPMGTSNGQASQLAANFRQGLERGLGVTAFLHTDEVNAMIMEAIGADGEQANELFRQVAYKVWEEQCMMETTVLTKPVCVYSANLKDAGIYAINNSVDTFHLAWLDNQ